MKDRLDEVKLITVCIALMFVFNLYLINEYISGL